MLGKVAQTSKVKYAEPFVIINCLNHSKTVDVISSIDKNFGKNCRVNCCIIAMVFFAVGGKYNNFILAVSLSTLLKLARQGNDSFLHFSLNDDLVF